jgi:hypothetical protein
MTQTDCPVADPRLAERALAGAFDRGRFRAALARVEDGLRRRARELDRGGGLLDPGARTRPTLARRERALRRQLSRLRTRAAALHRLASFRGAPWLRRQVGRLAGDLWELRSAEAGLLLEAMNTDLGVGD